MKKVLKPNILPIEIEIDNKLGTAYLFAAMAKVGNAKLGQLLTEVYPASSVELPGPTNRSINEKKQSHENN
jgi:hypothetical protein